MNALRRLTALLSLVLASLGCCSTQGTVLASPDGADASPPPECFTREVAATTTTFTPEPPSVAWTGSSYGLVWRTFPDENIHFALATARGIRGPETSVPTRSSVYTHSARVVWTGTEFGVAWIDNRNGLSELYFARLDAEGNARGGELRSGRHWTRGRDCERMWCQRAKHRPRQ